MAAFWVFVIAVFFMIVLAFGNIDLVSFGDVDGVRVAVTFLGIFMGVLVFAGALQLQNASEICGSNVLGLLVLCCFLVVPSRWNVCSHNEERNRSCVED